MRFAIYSPGFGIFADPRVLAGLARDAEQAGWDGYFIWDHVLFGPVRGAPMGDPFVTLAAMACTTERIRLGTLVTPLPRRLPWEVARQAVSLDHLSGGRFVLGVGIGSDTFGREYSAFGQPADPRLHAEMLDEALGVITGLWSGEPFSYEGKHYRVDSATFEPTPVQRPRIPIWVATTWPNKRPFKRAARWDGAAAQSVTAPLKPEDYREMVAFMRDYRPDPTAPFDITRTAFLPQGDPSQVRDIIASYAEAGVTWWLVPLEDDMGTLDDLRARIRSGPPR